MREEGAKARNDYRQLERVAPFSEVEFGPADERVALVEVCGMRYKHSPGASLPFISNSKKPPVFAVFRRGAEKACDGLLTNVPTPVSERARLR